LCSYTDLCDALSLARSAELADPKHLRSRLSFDDGKRDHTRAVLFAAAALAAKGYDESRFQWIPRLVEAVSPYDALKVVRYLLEYLGEYGTLFFTAIEPHLEAPSGALERVGRLLRAAVGAAHTQADRDDPHLKGATALVYTALRGGDMSILFWRVVQTRLYEDATQELLRDMLGVPARQVPLLGFGTEWQSPWDHINDVLMAAQSRSWSGTFSCWRSGIDVAAEETSDIGHRYRVEVAENLWAAGVPPAISILRTAWGRSHWVANRMPSEKFVKALNYSLILAVAHGRDMIVEALLAPMDSEAPGASLEAIADIAPLSRTVLEIAMRVPYVVDGEETKCEMAARARLIKLLRNKYGFKLPAALQADLTRGTLDLPAVILDALRGDSAGGL
jgi:hypothetical protein